MLSTCPHSDVGVPPSTRLWPPESTQTGTDGAFWLAFHGSLARLAEADEGVEAFNRLTDEFHPPTTPKPEPQVDAVQDATSHVDSSGESETELDEDERELAELERRERELAALAAAAKVPVSGSGGGRGLDVDTSSESTADDDSDDEADLRELEALERRSKELAKQLGHERVETAKDEGELESGESDDDDAKELAELEELEKKLRGELEQRKRTDL